MAVNDPATEPQLKAIYAIAAGADIAPDALPILAGKQLRDLTRGEASALIDKMKASPPQAVAAAPVTQVDGGKRMYARAQALDLAVRLLVSYHEYVPFDGLQSALFPLAARCEQWLYRD